MYVCICVYMHIYVCMFADTYLYTCACMFNISVQAVCDRDFG